MGLKNDKIQNLNKCIFMKDKTEINMLVESLRIWIRRESYINKYYIMFTGVQHLQVGYYVDVRPILWIPPLRIQ